MIVFWDNSPGTVVLWDDANEQITVIRPSNEDHQGQYPMEILVTEYEHIQFIEGMMSPQDAAKFINSEIPDADLKKKALEIYRTVMTSRVSPVGGTIMKNTYPMTQNYKNIEKSAKKE